MTDGPGVSLDEALADNTMLGRDEWHTADSAARADVCPSCGEPNGE